MINGWLLAILVTHGGSISTAQYGPFTNEQSCLVAAHQIEVTFTKYNDVVAVCLKQSQDAH